MSRKKYHEYTAVECVLIGSCLGVLPFVFIRPLCLMLVAVHRAL